jgi:AraC-like DNA-binding protein
MKYNDIKAFLREYCNVEMSKRSMSLFLRQSKRLGKENEEDFFSNVVIECLETKKKGSDLDDIEVYRAIDRVAHRLFREISDIRIKHVDNRYIDSVYAERKNSNDNTKMLIQLIDTISKLPPLHLILFEKIFIEGVSIQDVAQEAGVSKRTLYRQLNEIRNLVKDL